MNRISPSIFKYFAFCSIAIVVTCMTFSHSQAQTGPGNKGRTVIQMIEDTESTFKISNLLGKNKGLAEHSHINVTTIYGIVLLTGSVSNARDKKWVEGIAEEQPNTRKVINELRVEKVRNPLELGEDKFLQLSVKHRISRKLKELSPLVHIIVHRRTVYLMGVVTPEIAEISAKIARTTYLAERVVKIFEIKEPVS